jgi:hypothetical protein
MRAATATVVQRAATLFVRHVANPYNRRCRSPPALNLTGPRWWPNSSPRPSLNWNSRSSLQYLTCGPPFCCDVQSYVLHSTCGPPFSCFTCGLPFIIRREVLPFFIHVRSSLLHSACALLNRSLPHALRAQHARQLPPAGRIHKRCV